MRQSHWLFIKSQFSALLLLVIGLWSHLQSLADTAVPTKVKPADFEVDPQQNIFVVEKIFDLSDGFVCQSVFAGSTLEAATEYIDSRPEDQQYRYRVVQHNLDVWPEDDNQIVPPDVFQELLQAEISENLENMHKDGLVEQLVGEDGEFYYELTEKGIQAHEHAQRDEEKEEDKEENA